MFIRHGIVVGAVFMLAGCSGPASVKDMAQNPEDYSARYFNVSRLPPAVQKRLPAAGQEPLGYKRLELSGTLAVTRTGQPPIDMAFDITDLNDRNDGLTRRIWSRSLNTVRSSIDIELLYRGVFRLSTQTGFFRAARATPVESAHGIEEWPQGLADVKENAAYSYKASFGTSAQIANLAPIDVQCKSGSFYDAGRILSSLPGRAIDLACNFINASGVPVSTGTYAFITQYGTMVPVEIKTEAYTSRYRYDSIVAKQENPKVR
jgi:hypothetical protein